VTVAPQLTIEMDGRALGAPAMGKVVEVVVDSHLLLPSACLVTVADQQAEGLAVVGASIGAALKVKIAVGNNTTPSVPKLLFDGVITGYEVHDDEHRRVLKLQAYDKSYKLHVGRKTESLNQVSDTQIIQQIASAAGLRVGDLSEVNLPVHQVVHRINLTDWEFVMARARERGMVARMMVDDPAGAALVVQRPGGGTAVDASFQSGPGVVLTAFYPRVSGASSVKSVKVVSWDQKQATQVVGTASSPSGKSSAALGKNVTSIVNSAARSSQEVVVTDLAVTSPAEAENAAKGVLEVLAGAHAEADGTAVGRPDLQAGVLLNVKNVGPDVAGKWTLTQVRHVLDEDGYRCHFSASGLSDRGLLGLVRGDTAGPMSAGYQPIVGVVPAVVTNADDPDGLGRVKVKLAIDDKLETNWARVATLGAGEQRGLFMPLAVNDEVLVAFDRGDARAPYVVGSLYNQRNLLPKTSGDYAKDGKPTSWVIKSVSGNFLQFRDASNENFVKVDVKNGQFHIWLDGQKEKIVVKSNGTVEIEGMKDITIKSTSGKVNIEAAQDISIKSTGGGVNIEGLKTAVKGSASVDVNAPMVKVGGGQVMLG
jgi:uncharacterized protein involved in type VI secretion and phage assembly